MFSHRIHRTHRTFLLRYSPTDFTHRSYGAFKGMHLSQVHQHNKIYILPQNSEHILAGIFSHRFHRFTQNFLAGKNSVKSVDSVRDIRALTSVRICEICGSFFNYKLRVDSVGDIHALTSVRICEICGSFFNHKLRVDSVGVFQLQTSEKRVLPQAGHNVTAVR